MSRASAPSRTGDVILWTECEGSSAVEEPVVKAACVCDCNSHRVECSGTSPSLRCTSACCAESLARLEQEDGVQKSDKLPPTVEGLQEACRPGCCCVRGRCVTVQLQLRMRSQDAREKSRAAAAAPIEAAPAPSTCKVDTPDLLWLRAKQSVALVFGSCVLRWIVPHSTALASSREKKKKLQRPIMTLRNADALRRDSEGGTMSGLTGCCSGGQTKQERGEGMST